MAIIDLSRITRTYHNLQARRIEVMRRRIQAQSKAIAFGHVIPDPADLPIGRGRRIEAAVLFLDISGFTSRPSNTQDEQENNVRVLSLFFSEVIRVIQDYGGTVEKNTGDGVMAYFSRRSGGGDPRHRALACAITVFHAGDQFVNPIVLASEIMPLSYRICVDFGWITIARMGAAQRFNHIVAVGTAANRTSKMLGFAHGGEIMIGGDVLAGLPPEWIRAYVKLATTETGWMYPDGTAYPFFLFNGRWVLPAQQK